MYTCIATFKTSNGEHFKVGEEISSFKYHSLPNTDRNYFKSSEIARDYIRPANDSHVSLVMPDYVSPSSDSPSFSDSGSSDLSSSDSW